MHATRYREVDLPRCRHIGICLYTRGVALKPLIVLTCSRMVGGGLRATEDVMVYDTVDLINNGDLYS